MGNYLPQWIPQDLLHQESCRTRNRIDHANGQRRGMHGRPVAVEFGGIQVAVGIDQHRRRLTHWPVHTGLRLAMKASMPSAASSHIMLQAITSAASW